MKPLKLQHNTHAVAVWFFNYDKCIPSNFCFSLQFFPEWCCRPHKPLPLFRLSEALHTELFIYLNTFARRSRIQIKLLRQPRFRMWITKHKMNTNCCFHVSNADDVTIVLQSRAPFRGTDALHLEIFMSPRDQWQTKGERTSNHICFSV